MIGRDEWYRSKTEKDAMTAAAAQANAAIRG